MTPASATEAAAVAMIKRAARESFMFMGNLFQKNAIILGMGPLYTPIDDVATLLHRWKKTAVQKMYINFTFPASNGCIATHPEDIPTSVQGWE